jgi:hypothetical protein
VVADERYIKLGPSVLKNKSQSAVPTALEKLASELTDTQTAVDMRLAETVEQIAKRKQALDPFGLWQVAQAADDRGVDGEKPIQSAS